MTPAQMVDLGFQLSHTNSTQIGDGNSTTGETRAYQYLNIAKDRFWSAYVHARTGVIVDWERWTENIVAGQTEYPLPDVLTDTNGIKKMNSLGISYDGTTLQNTGKIKYTVARKVNPDTYQTNADGYKLDWYQYEENQPEETPIYFISDKSIFIAPSPKANVTNGIKLEGVKKITDYTSGTSQQNTVIPEEFHHVLVQGMLPFLYRKQGKMSQANAEMQEYERQEKEALIELGDFNQAPMFAKYPDEGNYFDDTKKIY